METAHDAYIMVTVKKAKLFLRLTKRHAMKTYVGLLISAGDRGE
jgi:hypothetical protein